MGKETYRIQEFWNDEVIAFVTAFGVFSEGEFFWPPEDFQVSTDFNNLESSFPPDTIQVATFLNKEYSTKKIFLCLLIYGKTLGSKSSRSIFTLLYNVE